MMTLLVYDDIMTRHIALYGNIFDRVHHSMNQDLLQLQS